jgi:DNA-binding MarR family transcriptional regulator
LFESAERYSLCNRLLNNSNEATIATPNALPLVVADKLTLDQESRLNIDDHFAIKIWLRMLTCANLIEADIRSGLRAEFESTLPRFDLLAQLERTPEGLLMNELSKRLMVTSGNVTALADQLESEGFIERIAVPNDRRATKINLTEPGRRKFNQMAVVHEQWVAQMFSSLNRAEQEQLHSLLAKLKTSLIKQVPHAE